MSTSRGFDEGEQDHKARRGAGLSRMASDPQHQQGSRGGGRPPWMVARDSVSEENVSTVTVEKEEHAPTNRSHEDMLRKAAFMYGSPLQALRATVARGNSVSAPSVERSAGAPFYNRKMVARRFENGMQSPQPQHQHQQHPNVEAPAGTKQPGTAQLTIFYAGMVNVYDDVPFDKAQAIMLLAGTGNAWQASSNYNMVGGANRGSRPFATPSGGTNQQPMSRAFFPAPQPSTPASSAGAPATPPDRPVPAAVELPQARKASLARFLEKRKDRVKKGPYSHPNEEAAKSDAMRRDTRDNSPSNMIPESSSKPSLSPTRKESNNNIGNGRKTYGNDSTSSHPPTPPRPSTSDSGKLQQFDISVRTERPVSPAR